MYDNPMTQSIADLRRDVDSLLESIRRDWLELETRPLNAKERAGVRAHILWAHEELGGLIKQLDEAKYAQGS